LAQGIRQAIARIEPASLEDWKEGEEMSWQEETSTCPQVSVVNVYILAWCFFNVNI
jgi:hypothetical protein